MNLLLLLSAMLTALSGAGLGTRAQHAPVAVNSVAATAAAVRIAAAPVVGRPGAAVSRLDHSSRAPVVVGWQLAPAAPLYLSRRRE